MRHALPLLLAALVGIATASCGDDDDGRTGDGGGPPPGACGDGSPTSLLGCVDGARLDADLDSLASGPRSPGDPGWEAAQNLCAEVFTEAGFTVERWDYGIGINVIGTKRGTTTPGEAVLVGAHYDSVPDCPGADDNASGTVGVLEAARVLGPHSFPRTLVVACWDQEEVGLIGSTNFVDDGRAMDVSVYYNLEMVGFTDPTPGSQTFPDGFDLAFPDAAAELDARDNAGDFIALIANAPAADATALLETYADPAGVPAIDLVVPDTLIDLPQLRDLRRSDHSAFWDARIPAIMITDTSEFRYAAYHCRDGVDSVEMIDRTFLHDVVEMTVGAAAASLGATD